MILTKQHFITHNNNNKIAEKIFFFYELINDDELPERSR
jgi:hypothetical protein